MRRQYQSAAKGGLGISFNDGSNTNWSTKDTNGQAMNNDSTEGVWENRTVDLSSFAGKTVNQMWVVADSGTPVGNWVILYGDISIVSADGTVTTIYDRTPTESFSYWSGGGETNPEAWVELKTTSGNIPTVSTSYYATNQVGSTVDVLSGGGWPVARNTVYPYGIVPSPSASPNTHKFAGMERDKESGQDHTKFRQYESIMGRFMSPDPYSGSYSLANPQSMNRYVYAMDNPISNVDPTGLNVEICGEEGSCEIITDQEYQGLQGWSGGVDGPAFSNVYNQGLAGIYDSAGNQVGTATYIPDDMPGFDWGGASNNDQWAGYTLAQQVFQGPGSGVFVAADKTVHGLAIATGAVAAPFAVSAAASAAPYAAAAGNTTYTLAGNLLYDPGFWQGANDFLDGTMPVGIPPPTYAALAGQVASSWDTIWNDVKRWW